jgi:hypothetical protein
MVDFVWRRPTDGNGYAWADCRPARSPREPQRALVLRDEARLVGYSPLKEKIALYRELAAAAPTTEGILAFANRYGLLGADVDMGEVEAAEGVSPRQLDRVEPLLKWVMEMVWLREAVRLWDLVRAKSDQRLAEVIRWERPGVARYKMPREVSDALGGRPQTQVPEDEPRHYKGWDIFASAPGGEYLRSSTREGDVRTPATLFVLGLINERLPRLVGPCLFLDHKRNRVVRQDMPLNLLGAIYLQFASAVLEQTAPRTCPKCGRWFDVAPGASRADRIFCSDTCRIRNFRERQRQAVQLHAEGNTPKEIARQLDATVKSVKGWIQDQQKRKGK